MSRKTLTDRAIKALKPRAEPYDTEPDTIVSGLRVRVMPSGVKSFVLIARYPGSRNPTRRSLGQYGELTLDAAREKARTWLTLIGRGIDPADEEARTKREADARRAITFGGVAEDYIRIEVYGPRGEKHPRQRTARATVGTLRDTLIPLFGHRPVTELTAVEIMDPIELIGQIGTDHALLRLKVRKQLRRPGRGAQPALANARALATLMGMVLSWAAEPDMPYGLDQNPLQRAQRMRKRKLGTATPRKRSFNDEELIAFQIAILRLNSPYREMYQLLLLSMLRLNEVARGRWSEMERDVWTIPPKRMKGKNETAREHKVPIVKAMRRVLDNLPRGNRGDFIFSKDGGETPIKTRGASLKERLDRLMLQVLRERAQARGEDPTKVRLVPFRNHDIRRTGRSNLTRLKIDTETAEAVLAHRHAGGALAATYDVWERYDEKSEALEKWAGFLAALTRPKVTEAGHRA